jgi:uncharacterized protein (TIGR02302 family)
MRIGKSRRAYNGPHAKRLRRALAWTHAGLWIENILYAFWPAFTWSAVAVAGGLLADRDFVLENAQTAGGLLAFGLLIFLAIGVRRLVAPDTQTVQNRIDETLSGTPIAGLSDNQAIGREDKASVAVWRAQAERMKAQLAVVSPVPPKTRLSKHDWFGLRFVGATALIVALLFGSSLYQADEEPDISMPENIVLAGGLPFEAWIRPPGYTGKPTVYLNELAGNPLIEVPTGSTLTLRLYGPPEDFVVAQDLVDGTAGTSSEAAFTLNRSGIMTVTAPDTETVEWGIVVIPDVPPGIKLLGELRHGLRGSMTLEYAAWDDYEVVGGTARITLNLDNIERQYGLSVAPELQEPIIFDLPLPISGDRREVEDAIVENVAKHAWAGLPVFIALEATDSGGQNSEIEILNHTLPERLFLDPVAASVAELRRDLIWNRENAERTAMVTRAIMHLPDELDLGAKSYLMLRTALRRLEIGMEVGLTTETRDSVADLLWELAVLLEDGDVSDAEERLRRAQDRLAQALEEGASPDQIAELMEELRRAMQEYMQALANEAEQNGEDQQQAQAEGQEITSDQLQEIMDRIQELADQGRHDEARELLRQLQEMMQNMQTARQQQNQQNGGEGEQSMRELQDTLRQQQGLSDDAFRQLQEQFNNQRGAGQSQDNEGRNGDQGRGQSHEGGSGQERGQDNERPGGGSEGLAARQQALSDMLRQQQENLPGGQGTPESEAARDALDRAGEAMDRAADALGSGDNAQALDDQGEAMDALREGIQELGNQMANQEQAPGRQGAQDGRDRANARDPLGRRSGSGQLGGNEELHEGEDQRAKSRAIRDELYRRSGERTRPQLELEYLDRLLRQF